MDPILRNILMLGSMMIFIVVVSQACLPQSCSPPKKVKTTPFPQPPRVNRTVIEPNIRAGRKSLECVFTYKSFWDVSKRKKIGKHDIFLIMDKETNESEYKKCDHQVVNDTYYILREHALRGPVHFPGWYKRGKAPANAQFRCVTYFFIKSYDRHETVPYPHTDYDIGDDGIRRPYNHTALYHCIQHSYLIRGCLYDKIMFGTAERYVIDPIVNACATCATHRCNDYYYIIKPNPIVDKYRDQYDHDRYFPQVSKADQERVDAYVKRNPIVYTIESYLADAGRRGRRTRALQAENRKWFARPEIVDSEYYREEPEEEDTRVLVNIEKFLFNYFKIKRPDKIIEKRMETVMQCNWQTI